MELLADILKYEFFHNALLASLSIGVVCGIIGTYIVSRRVVFLTGGITHASFGGIGIAYYMGLNPFMGALFFALLSSLGMQYVVDRGGIREDSAIGVLWSIGMTIGIIFIFITPGYAPNLMSYLFGNILTLSGQVVLWSYITAAVLVFFMAMWHRTVQFVAFDRSYAASQSMPTKAVGMIMIAFTAIAIVLTLKLAGIVLLISLITLPSITAALVSRRYLGMTIYACTFASIGMVSGVILSYYTDLPPGASIVASLSLIYIVTKIATILCRK